MHAVLFGVKRVHIESVRFTTNLIRFSTLTPARYDLMRIIHMHPEGVHQSTLGWLLGVTAPVVSRMLSALERQGFVEREKDGKDRRCRIVRLTTRGGIALGVARSAALDDPQAEGIVARALTGDRRLLCVGGAEREAAIDDSCEEVAAFDSFLLSIRHALVDRAPYHHPWQRPPFLMPVPFTRLAAERVACRHLPAEPAAVA